MWVVLQVGLLSDVTKQIYPLLAGPTSSARNFVSKSQLHILAGWSAETFRWFHSLKDEWKRKQWLPAFKYWTTHDLSKIEIMCIMFIMMIRLFIIDNSFMNSKLLFFCFFTLAGCIQTTLPRGCSSKCYLKQIAFPVLLNLLNNAWEQLPKAEVWLIDDKRDSLIKKKNMNANYTRAWISEMHWGQYLL